MSKKFHYIDDGYRLRVGNFGIFKSVLILEAKKKFFFFKYWVKVDFTFAHIHETLDDAAGFMLNREETKAKLSRGDLNKLFSK
jgi:hypothetical protein